MIELLVSLFLFFAAVGVALAIFWLVFAVVALAVEDLVEDFKVSLVALRESPPKRLLATLAILAALLPLILYLINIDLHH